MTSAASHRPLPSQHNALSEQLAALGSWQTQLKNAYRSSSALLNRLQLPALSVGDQQSNQQALIAAENEFPVLAPEAFVQRMALGDPNDPLLQQVLAVPDEADQIAGFSTDPLGELAANPVPGIIHKYHGRLLLLPTSGCAVNCRYCFRRHFPYEDNRLDKAKLAAALAYIATHDDVSEIILSGGDPLLLDDNALHSLVVAIEANKHVRRLRIHTRLPVVIPARVTPTLLQTLSQSRLDVVVVLHSNHANEMDEPLRVACQSLHRSGITLLNQSVLLKGVNDSVDALVALSEGLFAASVLPYYLHVLDPVQGAAHFHLSITEAQRLHRDVAARLPGYLVPRLAQEIAGEAAKRWL
jgi:EF-P beta-lysylation protein EpmB